MKQVMQDLSSGSTYVIDAPAPQPRPGHLLIDTRATLVSAGTERMLMQFGRSSLLNKARQQPDKVKQVLAKARTDGPLATLDAVRSKLAQPIPLGYANVGTVRDVGRGVTAFAPGDRVVSNGPHAEVVSVGSTLCARVPEAVSDEAAAFTVLASIGLQGIRLAAPTLGESVAVIGAGIIGLLTIQMLRANGCRVLAVDTNPDRLALAASFGAEVCNPAAGGDAVAAGLAFSAGGQGIDAVIVTASTQTNEVMAQAARMSRKRGRIVLVGVAGLKLERADFYEKELSFQVSCSYGPGRYDPQYEEQGQDYPFGFVRWTEQRNFEAVLELLRSGALDVAPLITHRFPIEQVPEAYEVLGKDPQALGIILTFSAPLEQRQMTRLPAAARAAPAAASATIGCIGAGNFASRVLIPALQAAGADLHTIVSSGGLSAAVEARRSSFRVASSDIDDVLGCPEIDTALILTRHGSHARLAAEALRRGKHVFVEKPLAIDREGLADVRRAAAENPERLLMVGFNRRFSPLAQALRAAAAEALEPSALIVTVNAGALPASHWAHRESEGGRVIGEGCHFVDLARYLIGAPITGVSAVGLPALPGTHPSGDSAVITLAFADGSVAAIQYLANGSAAYPKERVELFNGGRVLAIDNFRALTAFGWRGVKARKLWRQDKGHAAEMAAFVAAVRSGGPSPIPVDELFEVHEATLEAARQLAGAEPAPPP